MDAVYELLKELPASDLTMDTIARRANVGKPTLYKWWPSKAAIILAMFHERFSDDFDSPKTSTAEKSLRARMKHLIVQCNGLFGKVVADLLAEGQRDPSILQDLYQNHIRQRRAAASADIERGIASGELTPHTNPELLMDAIFSPIYMKLLLRSAPITEVYGHQLLDQALVGVRSASIRPRHPRLPQNKLHENAP
jgi:AcrR family transcriptional regulator